MASAQLSANASKVKASRDCYGDSNAAEVVVCRSHHRLQLVYGDDMTEVSISTPAPAQGLRGDAGRRRALARRHRA